MTKTSTLAIAAALMMASSPLALAQDMNSTTTGQQIQPNVNTGTGAGAGMGTEGGAGVETDATTGAGAGATVTTPSTDTGTGVELDDTSENLQVPSTRPGDVATGMAGTAGALFVQTQTAEMFRGTNLMGADVMSAANEDIGDVNDVLFDMQGQGVAIVVGVGGFLGIGEKNVAVPFERLTVSRDDEGDDIVISLDTTRDELNAAPEFQTLEDNATASTTTEGVTPTPGMGGAVGTEGGIQMNPGTNGTTATPPAAQ